MRKFIYTHPINGETYMVTAEAVHLEPSEILWEGAVDETPPAQFTAMADASTAAREAAEQATVDGKQAAADAIKSSTSNATLKAALINFLGI